jgi:prophage regulatory protein
MNHIQNQETKTPKPWAHLMRISDVTKITGISRSYLYQLSKEGLFPKSVNLVPGGTSVAWVASEVQDWIDARIAERDGGAANA